MLDVRNFLYLFMGILLVACGGSGGGSVSTPSSPISKLYIAGGDQLAIKIYDSAQTADGLDLPDREITGGSTQLTLNYGIDYDGRTDSIFVGNWDNSIVLMFDDVDALDGDISPSRTLTGAATNIITAHDTAVDELRNLLYVAGDHGVTVYSNASTVNGDVAPVRHITGASTTISGGSELRMALDSINDRMFITDPNRSPAAVLVFDNISTLDGDVSPNRVIAGANTNFDYPWGIAIDVSRDILYIGDQNASAVFIFTDASTQEGDVAPTRTITGAISTINGVSDTFVDEVADELYVTDANSDSILVWDKASQADGDLAPSRSLTNGFSYPGGLIGAE